MNLKLIINIKRFLWLEGTKRQLWDIASAIKRQKWKWSEVALVSLPFFFFIFLFFLYQQQCSNLSVPLSFFSLSCAFNSMWRVLFPNHHRLGGKCFPRLQINIQLWVLLARPRSLMFVSEKETALQTVFPVTLTALHVCAASAHVWSFETLQCWKWPYLHVSPEHSTHKQSWLFLLLRCYNAPSLYSLGSGAPEGLLRVVVYFSSSLLTPSALLPHPASYISLP